MFTFIFAAALSYAHADATQTVYWPSRQSKVICGGMVDGEQLDFRVSTKNEVITADSDRYIVYVDLAKPGRVHWLIADVLSDADYARREEIAAKLSPEDAALIRAITPTRQTNLYAGFTEGYANLDFITKTHKLSLSCQEIQGQQQPQPAQADLDSALTPVEEPSTP